MGTLRFTLGVVLIASSFANGVSVARGAVVISPDTGYAITWDGNDGLNIGGPVPANLSTTVGTQIQSGFLAFAPHDTPGNVNNGTYGNASSWISNDTANPGWVGVNLNGEYDLSSLAWGRDNLAAGFTDRALGTYTVQITNSVSPSAASQWTTIGMLTYNSTGNDAAPGGLFTPSLRHEYGISTTGSQPITATGLRLIVPDDTSANGTAIDELEIYGTANPSVKPVSTTGLKSWLKADGEVVTSGALITQMSDHSFNNNNATAGVSPDLAAGAINGLPAARFDNDHLNLPNTNTALQIAGGDYEIFVVAKSNSPATQFITSGGATAFELQLNGGVGARFIPGAFSGAASVADLGVSGMFADNRAHLFNTRVDAAGIGYLRASGMENGDTVAGAASAFAGILTLGIRGNSTLPLVGDLGEVLIYDRALSTGERRQVEQYLARKWNAPLNVASQTQGGVAFANQVISGGAIASHQIDHLNNALYGNTESWIGANTGAPGAFAGVKFDRLMDISSLAFGRAADGLFTDRTLGTYTFQYTLDDFDALDQTSILNANWLTFLTVTYDGSSIAPWLRHQYDFAELKNVFGVRVLLSDNTLAIDELEIYGLWSVPEPSSLVLWSVFGLGLAGVVWRKRKQPRDYAKRTQ